MEDEAKFFSSQKLRKNYGAKRKAISVKQFGA